MATSCDFITAEASTKSWFRSNRLIDEYLKIINLAKFRTENSKWSAHAKEKYGVEGRLFGERQMLDHIQAVPNKEMFKKIDNAKGINYQLEEQSMSKASPETLSKVMEAAKKMGISLQSLSDYVKGNPDVSGKGINALADTLRGVIAIAEGKENVALTEETVHIATAILEQINPKLVTQMISKIDRFSIYKQTLNAYKGNKNYQLPNGKPNIRKIKKEAVDKLIAEVIINDGENQSEFPELQEETPKSMVRTWWNNILDFIRGIYRKANIDVFQEVAEVIISGDVGEVSQLQDSEIYYQLSDPQKEFQKRVLETSERIRKVESDEAVDPMFRDTEEASNWYEVQEEDGSWRRVKRRVTDRVKAWYKTKFFSKEFTEQEKEFNELKRTLGVKYHNFFEEIHGRYFNKDGTRKTNVAPRPAIDNRVDREAYNKLENYFVELVNQFSEDGKQPLVFSEVVIYDEKNDEAGTLDLLIVEENGEANIFDWKFMSVAKGSEDIPWFKKGAYNIQLGRYKDILKERYGVTKMGRNRAIPILFDFKKENPKVADSPIVLNGMKVGSADVSKIENLKLLPVSEKTESTGYEDLDKVIAELNAVYNQLGKGKAITEEEKEFKSRRLNLLERAIRVAQAQANLAPLTSAIKEIEKEGEFIINDYNTIYKDKPFDSEEFTDEQLSEFAEELREYMNVSEIFSNITTHIGDMIYDDKNPPSDPNEKRMRKKILFDMILVEKSVDKSRKEIDNISKDFADNFIGKRNSEADLLSPEAIIKGLTSYFRGVSELPLASLRILYRLVTNGKGKAMRDSTADTERIMAIREKLKKRGGDLRKTVQKLYQRDNKNKLVNKLIYKYDKAFYDAVKDNALEPNRNKQWLYDNIDVEAYKKESSEIMNRNIKHIRAKYAADEELMDKMILDERRMWDIDRKDFRGWDNYVIRRHPKDKWFSKEYLEIQKDEDLFELYNFITELNDRAKDVGYIQNKAASTFLPFVRKSMAENLAWGVETSAIKNWGKALQIDASTVGYGAVNELTGELEYSIPKYFAYDFTQTEDGQNDYSDVSEDLFKNIILYSTHMNKYKYLSAVEGQLKLIKDIEKFKDHYVTSRFGQVEFENGKPVTEKGNIENTAMFDKFLRGVLYEQKYPLSDSDVAIGVGAIDYMKKAINRMAGQEIFTVSDKPSAISLMKSVDAINRAFQLKTLGLEFISGAVNAFGGNIQVATQAGNYFKAREVFSNEAKLIGNHFANTEEREMFVQLVQKFMPMKDDPMYEDLKKSGMTTLTRHNFSDLLMVFMRKPEQHLEKSVFLTLLQNTMVENGRIVSIREFVKNKYKDRYKTSSAYKEAKQKIEAEIEELKKTRSIDAIKKLEDGKLVIPGLDLNNSSELQRLTNLTRRISRNATGGTSDSDLNMASFNIITRSMMVFKNWIPKLIDTRFSHFRQVADDFSLKITEDGQTLGDKYDIGRIRLLGYVLGTSIREKSNNIYNILSMNEKGILALDKMYEDFADSYMQRTGKVLNMSEEDFKDLIYNNLRNQMKELAMGLSLLSAGIAMGMMTPPEDADKSTKNAYRFAQRVVGKFEDELLFFYNPVQFQKMLNGGIFPALGLFSDVTRFVDHFIMETTGMDLSDPTLTADEVKEKAQPIKNAAKMFPVTKSMMTYGAILSSDFADEFDIAIQKQNNLR